MYWTTRKAPKLPQAWQAQTPWGLKSPHWYSSSDATQLTTCGHLQPTADASHELGLMQARPHVARYRSCMQTEKQECIQSPDYNRNTGSIEGVRPNYCNEHDVDGQGPSFDDGWLGDNALEHSQQSGLFCGLQHPACNASYPAMPRYLRVLHANYFLPPSRRHVQHMHATVIPLEKTTLPGIGKRWPATS